MRIAQIAPLTEAIPPRLYGGTERVIHWLTEELVAIGHQVTLFRQRGFPHLCKARAYLAARHCDWMARWWVELLRDPISRTPRRSVCVSLRSTQPTKPLPKLFRSPYPANSPRGLLMYADGKARISVASNKQERNQGEAS